jgi:hypothetical protein
MKLTVGKNVLLPADMDAHNLMRKKAVGDEFEFEELHPRSLRFNAYIFAAIARIAKAHGTTTDDMKARLLIETHRFRMIPTSYGKRVIVLPSMGRHNWTMKQLQDFWDDARKVIRDKLLNGLPKEEVSEIAQLLEGSAAIESDHAAA